MDVSPLGTSPVLNCTGGVQACASGKIGIREVHTLIFGRMSPACARRVWSVYSALDDLGPPTAGEGRQPAWRICLRSLQALDGPSLYTLGKDDRVLYIHLGKGGTCLVPQAVLPQAGEFQSTATRKREEFCWGQALQYPNSLSEEPVSKSGAATGQLAIITTLAGGLP